MSKALTAEEWARFERAMGDWGIAMWELGLHPTEIQFRECPIVPEQHYPEYRRPCTCECGCTEHEVIVPAHTEPAFDMASPGAVYRTDSFDARIKEGK